MQTQAQPKPGERGFQPGCGCCVGPEDDRCCCHFHQDLRRGLRASKCSIHIRATAGHEVRSVPVHRLRARLTMIDDGNAGTGAAIFAEELTSSAVRSRGAKHLPAASRPSAPRSPPCSPSAETGAAFAEIARLEAEIIALAARRGYRLDQITEANYADDGKLASIGCGQTDDGMARFILNFAL